MSDGEGTRWARQCVTQALMLGALLLILVAAGAILWWRTTSEQWREWREEKRPALAAAAAKAQPIIDALETYHRDHGRYPGELQALVPEYLEAIAEPPPPLRYGWEYYPLAGGEEFMLFATPRQNYSGVMPMPPSNAEFLVYESDGTYTVHPLNAGQTWGTPPEYEPWDRFGEWAYYR